MFQLKDTTIYLCGNLRHPLQKPLSSEIIFFIHDQYLITGSSSDSPYPFLLKKIKVEKYRIVLFWTFSNESIVYLIRFNFPASRLYLWKCLKYNYKCYLFLLSYTFQIGWFFTDSSPGCFPQTHSEKCSYLKLTKPVGSNWNIKKLFIRIMRE